jgi:hypothetical protein
MKIGDGVSEKVDLVSLRELFLKAVANTRELQDKVDILRFINESLIEDNKTLKKENWRIRDELDFYKRQNP